MKDFEWLLRQHYRATGKKPDTRLVSESHANPKTALATIGEKLLRIIAVQADSRRLVGELWRRYLLDCKLHGVEPVKRS